MSFLFKTFKWIGITVLTTIVVLIAIIYYIEVKKPENTAKNRLLNKNPSISKVYSLKNVRGWGENPEYSGIVIINGERCRIWTFGHGKISDYICSQPIK